MSGQERRAGLRGLHNPAKGAEPEGRVVHSREHNPVCVLGSSLCPDNTEWISRGREWIGEI